MFSLYKPEREIRDYDFIQERFLKHVWKKLKDYDYQTISGRTHRNLEYCTAEILNNLLIQYYMYIYNHNDYMKIKTKVKFDKIISLYSECFSYTETENYLFLLGQRMLRNLFSCECDLFNLYGLVDNITSGCNLKHLYLRDGFHNILKNNNIRINCKSDIKIFKTEIYNLYKVGYKNIED
jgi:hypothetical protein